MKKIFLFSLVTVIVALAVFWFYQNPQKAISLVRPEDFNLKEGDLVGVLAVEDPDIFIINQHGYKRLFLNPLIFGFYGHLGGFDRVKKISATTRDAFITSVLFQNCEARDAKVYALEITGEDTGALHWINVSGAVAATEDPQFFNKIFCINNNEFDWYKKGDDYTSLSQIFDYSFTKPTPPPGLAVDLKINNSDNPGSVPWNSDITATWTSSGASYCTGFGNLVLNELKDVTNLQISGTLTLKARALVPTYFAQIPIYLACVDSHGRSVDEIILLDTSLESRPTIKLTSLTGSETINLGSSYKINWNSSGFTHLNIILHQKPTPSDSFGKFWYIARNISNTNNYEWNTASELIPDENRQTTTTKISGGDYVIILTDDFETYFEVSKGTLTLQN